MHTFWRKYTIAISCYIFNPVILGLHYFGILGLVPRIGLENLLKNIYTLLYLKLYNKTENIFQKFIQYYFNKQKIVNIEIKNIFLLFITPYYEIRFRSMMYY